MPITYHPARLEDLDAADGLVVACINDLTERHGFGRMASSSPPRFQSLCLGDNPRGLWTAVDGEEPVGFAWSWACDNFWFLAQLFVKPGLQARGVGTALLRRTLHHADEVGARQRALITFAFNSVSQGLYIRHGFLPRFPIYFMSIPRERLVGRAHAALDVIALVGSEMEMAAIAEIDAAAIGVSREKHHPLLAGEPGIRGFGLCDRGSLVGYAYVSQGGHIGPLAVITPDLMGRAFEAILAIASDGATKTVSCFVPGSNAGMLCRATSHGLRINFPMLMMSTEEIGTWPCYLPRNPGFM